MNADELDELDNLDGAIDRAVRELTRVDAPADMTARVLARIEDAPPLFPWMRVAAGALVVALVIVTLVLVRSRDSRIRLQPSEVVRSSPAVEAPAAAAPPQPAPDADRSRDAFGHRRVVAAAIAADDGVERIGEIDPLANIDPIVVTPLEHESFAPPSIAISPLTPIMEIQIGPLSPSGGRD